MVYLKVERIKLQHIRCFDKIEVSFTTGVNVISGSNGSGKSTILTSIGYGLFGSSYLYGMDFTISDLIQRGYSKGKIWLTFQTDQGRYTSEQTIREGKSNIWKIWKEGIPHPITETISESREVIEQLLGGEIDHTIFKNALCSRQGELTALIDETSSTRRDQIRKILGLERFITASHHLTKFQKSVDEKLKTSQEKIGILEETTQDPQILQEKLKKLIEKKQTLTDQIEQKSKKYQLLKSQVEEMQKTKNLISQKSEISKDLTVQLEKIDEEILSLKKQKKKYEKKYNLDKLTLESVRKLINNSNEKLDILNDEYQNIKTQISKYEDAKNQVDEIKKKLNETNESLHLLEQKKSDILGEETLDELEQKKKKLKEFSSKEEEEINQLEQQIKSKEQLQSQYLSLKQELQQDVDKLTTEFKEIFEDKPSSASEIKSELEEKEKTFTSALERLKEFRDNYQQELSDLKARHELIEKTIQLLEDDTVSHDCPVCLRKFEESSIGKLKDHHSSELNDLASEITKFEEKMQKQINGIEKLEYKLELVQTKLMKLGHLIEEIEELPIKINRINELHKNIDQLQTQLETIRNKYQEMQQKKQENVDQKLTEITNTIETLESISEKLKDKEYNKRKYGSELEKHQEKMQAINFSSLNNQKSDLNTNRKNVQKEISSLNTEVMGTVQSYNMNMNEKEEKEKRLAKLIEDLNDLKGDFDGERFEKNKEKVDKFNQELGSLKQRYSTITEEQIPKIEEEISENKKHHQKLQQYKANLEKYYKIKPKAHKIEKILEKTPDILIQQKSSALSNYLTNMLRRMLPDREFSKVVFQTDGDLLLYNEKQIIEKSTLSGGERTVLALAMRLALADYVAPLKFLILDEPTNHLDAQRVAEFIEIIDREQIFSDADGQLLLVTHREEFDRNAQQSIQLAVNNGKRTVIR